MSEPAVQIDRLCRTFGARAALDGVSFAVQAGEIFGLLGPNGGGKSTLFRILSTLLAPTGGSAQVFGVDVADDPAAVRRRIGVVFQAASLDKVLTVSENLHNQGHLYGLRGAPLHRRVSDLLERFDLTDRSGDRVGTLSGGLARRVEVAKGMLHKPDLLLLDEPSTGLDPSARRQLRTQLEDIRATDGVTVLMTTHIMEEGDACDRLVLLDQGHVVAHGSPKELKDEIAGQVITIETSDSENLCKDIAEKFDVACRAIHGTVRLELDDAHEFARRVAAEFGDRIESLTVGKPTLEDVFLDKTGHRLRSAENGETDQ